VEKSPPRAPSPLPLAAIAGALAALVALRWLATGEPTLPGRFYALDVGTILRLSHEHLLRVPRCPACGPPPRAVPSPWFAESP
jgi:bacteriocin biosynthesis cyclodehydratase domain-containing protein